MAKKARKAKARAAASKKRTGRKLDAPADLRTMVAVAAWGDQKFADLVRSNPKAAVTQLAKEYNIKVPQRMKFTAVEARPDEYPLFLLPNPAGELKTARLKAGPGGIRTVTADCWCSDTTTGRCSCMTIAGTPCLGCRTSTSRCFCD